VTDAPRQPACPICGEPRSPRHRPFCSPRCADVDLQRWLAGRYVIPVGEDEDQSEEYEARDLAGQREGGEL
jgi:hypothetical protein